MDGVRVRRTRKRNRINRVRKYLETQIAEFYRGYDFNLDGNTLLLYDGSVCIHSPWQQLRGALVGIPRRRAVAGAGSAVGVLPFVVPKEQKT